MRKGDPVALIMPNAPQHVVAFYATLRLGAVVVEHNPLYTADELTTQFADHGATVAVAWVSEFLVGAVEAAQHSLGVTETFVGKAKGKSTSASTMRRPGKE